MLLWPQARKAKVYKGQDRCQIKQLLNRELGCDPQIRNGDLSQQQGKTFLQLLPHLMKCNLHLQFRLKEIGTLHLRFNLFYPSYWGCPPIFSLALNCRHLREKISRTQVGREKMPSWKMKISQHNTKYCNITFIHITLFGTVWKLDNLYNSNDLN